LSPAFKHPKIAFELDQDTFSLSSNLICGTIRFQTNSSNPS